VRRTQEWDGVTRPRYETESDRANEREVAQKINAAWGVEVVKLPNLYPSDYAITKGKHITALLEIKCRTHEVDTFETLWLSLWKVSGCKMMALEAEIPFYLVVRFKHEIRWLMVSQKYPVIFAGRTDRGDWQDMEPVVEFPVSKFNKLL